MIVPSAALWPVGLLVGLAALVLALPPLAAAAFPDARARLARANAPHHRPARGRPGWVVRLLRRARLRARHRLEDAGLEGVAPVALAGWLLGAAAAGLGVAELVLPEPPVFFLLALAGGAAAWAQVGRVAHARRDLLRAQIAALVRMLAGGAGASATPEQALRVVLAQGVEPPLAAYLEPLRRELEAPQGVADRSFVELIGALAAHARSRPLRQVHDALETSTHQHLALREALATIAAEAGAQLSYEAQTWAEFAYLRSAARLIFCFPALLTAVLRLALPDWLPAAYGQPVWGWAVALGLSAWCWLSYRLVVGAARRALPQYLDEDDAEEGAGGPEEARA